MEQPSIFAEPVEPQVFQSVNTQGTGSQSMDQFISDRVALMSDETDLLRNLNVAQQNVTNLDNEQLRSYVDGIATKAFADIKFNVIEQYATTGDIDTGVLRAKEVDDMAGEPTSVRKLAEAAPQFLSRFKPYSIPREIARRQFAAMLIAAQMEQAGITPDSFGKKAKGLLGQFIPGRRVYQDLTADYSVADSVKNLHRLSDEDFLKALPDAMDAVMEMSGNNPFYFLERMQAYLDPGDVAYLRALFALDAVDAATTVVAVGKIMKMVNFTRAANTPIKILRDSGDTKRAAELNAAALSDEDAAGAARTTKADAAQSTSPFGGEGLDPDVTERLAAETQEIIAARQVTTQEILKPLHDENFLIKRSAWTPEEVAKANTKYLNQFAGKASVKEQLHDGFIAEVSIERPRANLPDKAALESEIGYLSQQIDELSEQIDLYKAQKVSKKDPLLKQMIDQKQTLFLQRGKLERNLDRVNSNPANTPNQVRLVRVKYRNNDFGELEATEYEKSIRFLNSPSTNVEQMQTGIVEQATKIDYESAKVLDIFFRARNAAIKGLSKQQRRDLDSILLEGDRNQVTYADMDLVRGIRTPEGLIKLQTAEQIGAYRAIRDTFDTLYVLKNRELRQSLELGNFKAVFPKINGEKVTNFVNPNKVISSDDLARIKRIYNFDTEMVQDVASINIKNVLDWKVYELKYPLEVGEEVINYVIAKPNSIKSLPKYVLDKRIGYVPKIDKNVFWVAEMVGNKLVNGNTVDNYSTVVRYFDNPLDANDWATAQNAKGQAIRIRSGREWLDLEPGRQEEFEAQIFGGLYGGKRGTGKVPFGLEGTEAERLGGVEAMEAYMNHIATRMPAVNFRASLVQRFLNSAKDPLTGKSYLSNPADWRSEISKNTPTRERNSLKAMQAWVSDQIRIPTTEERVWGNFQQSVAESVSRVPGVGRTLSRWAMDIGARDVTAQIRGLSFHATLGWFNPSQLFVQAMGASLAASINPIAAPRIMAKSLALRAAMFAQSDDAIKAFGKAAMIDGDDFLRMVRAYQKTGLHESTLSTGDWNAMMGMPNGMEGIRYLAQKGLVFFKEGERFARNYAWIQAYEDVTKGGKLVGKLSDEMIDAITDRHLRYTLNLNRANRAFWQKGFLSIPTQFWQISTKFIENMLPQMILRNPHGWTGKEKAMVMLGQMALFGGAGIPYGRAMIDNLTHWLQSTDEYGLGIEDPAAITAIQGGLSEYLLYNWTGERLDVTNRLSIPAGIEQMIEIMSSEQKTTADVLMGVSGQLSSRTWDAIKLNSQILYAVVKDSEADFDADVAVDLLDNVGQIASSWRNHQKARLWERIHYIPDRAGNKIIPIDDTEDRALLFAQKLGIAPKVLDEYYTIKAFNKTTEEDLREAAISVMIIGQRYMNDPDMLTNQNKVNRMRTEIQMTLLGFTEDERAAIMRQVDSRMKNENYLLPEAMEKALDNMYNSEGSSDLQGNATMVGD